LASPVPRRNAQPRPWPCRLSRPGHHGRHGLPLEREVAYDFLQGFELTQAPLSGKARPNNRPESVTMTGKIQRVPLHEVWKHEALDLTKRLRDNFDALNNALEMALSNPEREQSASDFNVYLVAEEDDGNHVLIANQIEKCDHGHHLTERILGSLLLPPEDRGHPHQRLRASARAHTHRRSHRGWARGRGSQEGSVRVGLNAQCFQPNPVSQNVS